jgi:hypothetical protein
MPACSAMKLTLAPAELGALSADTVGSRSD